MPFINFSSAKTSLKLTIILLSILTCGVIVFFVGLLVGKVIFWMDIEEINNALFRNNELLSIWQQKYFQAVQSIVFFIVPGIFLHWLFSSEQQEYFLIKKMPNPISVLLVVFVLIVSIPFFNKLIEFNKSIEIPSFLGGLEAKVKNLDNSYNDYTKRLLSGGDFGSLIYNIFIIAILPAIGEELIFRGVLQKFFVKSIGNINMAVVTTAILFSAVHGQFYGFIPRFILGLFFGYLMIWGKTIWLPILAHFINNTISVVTYYLHTNMENFKLPDSLLSTKDSTIIISSALTFFMLIFIKRVELKPQKS